MKIKFTILTLLFVVSQLFGQNYPVVSIYDIQFIPADSIAVAPHDYPSPYNGDTLTIVGVVMNAPFRYDQPTVAVLHAGGPAIYLQDTTQTAWSGIIVRKAGITSSAFDALDTAMIVKMTGVVSEYYTTTQFNLISFEAGDVIGMAKRRPKPVKLSISDFVNPDGSPKYEMEKYEGVYVEIQNVTVTNEISTGAGSFGIFDKDGLKLMVGNQSDYYRSKKAPLAGTKISYIRGTIENRTNIAPYYFIINPIYPDDIKYGNQIPANIINVKRDIVAPGLNQDVKISAQIKDPDGVVDSAKLYYSLNNGNLQVVNMTLSNQTDSTFTATIPGQPDSTFVTYYIKAVDNQGLVSTNPSNPQKDRFFFMMLGRPLKIQDVQYSPLGTGYSGYDGYNVTVRGVVTADTTDFPSMVYIQNGTGPWSGILLNGTEPLKFKRGYDVTVTGTVNENYGITWIEQINAPSQVTINDTGAAVPQPYKLSTAVIDKNSPGSLPAESFEGVLVKYTNVKVVNENADGKPGPDQGSGKNRNFGEMFVADTSKVPTRVELQNGNNSYNNYWDASQEKSAYRIRTGNSFKDLTGILYYSYGNYKLIPRKNSDFVGFTTDVRKEKTIVNKYILSQNYPNPFNPSTNIQYTIMKAERVKLTVFNLLGQKVKILVNKFQSPGKYNVHFNGSDLPSGIYFYKITAGAYQDVKKMILLK